METRSNYLQKEIQVVEAIKTVYDPEIPINVYDLGLIYEITVSAEGVVNITMTLTNPNCPVADELPLNVKMAVEAVEGITAAHVHLVFEPEWNKDRMSDAALLDLGLL